jgi:hypothetical protein
VELVHAVFSQLAARFGSSGGCDHLVDFGRIFEDGEELMYPMWDCGAAAFGEPADASKRSAASR